VFRFINWLAGIALALVGFVIVSLIFGLGFSMSEAAVVALVVIGASVKVLYYFIEGHKQQTPIGAVISLVLIAAGVWYAGHNRDLWMIDFRATNTIVLGTLLTCVTALKVCSLSINVLRGMDFGAASGGRK